MFALLQTVGFDTTCLACDLRGYQVGLFVGISIGFVIGLVFVVGYLALASSVRLLWWRHRLRAKGAE